MTSTPTRPLTVADARLLLWQRAEDELAEERLNPPTWAPFSASFPALEVRAAHTAALSRVEHTRRLLALPDDVLARLLADNSRSVNLAAVRPGHRLPR